MTTQQDLSFFRGETWTVDCEVNGPEDADLDLSGAALEFRISSQTATLLTLTDADGIEITDAATGTCQVNVGPGDQAAIAPGGIYFYEFRVTDADGGVSVQARGRFIVLKSLFVTT